MSENDNETRTKYEPRFDRDVKRGIKGEEYAHKIINDLAFRRTKVEVKCDAHTFSPRAERRVRRGHGGLRYFVEYKCMGEDGVWRPSGICHPKLEAEHWTTVFGRSGGEMTVEIEWMKRAYALAKSNPKNDDKPGGSPERPTRGVYVYDSHLLFTRDKSLDDHWEQEDDD
jgi:hypothetical protein